MVVMDYEEGLAYTFGRHGSPDLAGIYPHEEEDWQLWNGDLLWLHIPRLFQWEDCMPAPNGVLAVNWPQVGAWRSSACLCADELIFDRMGLIVAS